MSKNTSILSGRLAPSPTGALHVGNVRTFLVAWLATRAYGGRVILRIEDLEKPASGVALEEMLSDLTWLGFDWDEGPAWSAEDEIALAEYRRFPKVRLIAERRMAELSAAAGSATWVSKLGRLIEPIGDHAPYIQSQRGELYEAIFERLREQNLIYPCVCARSDYAARAPHADEVEARYPGTCRDRWQNWQEANVWLHQENIEAIAQGRKQTLLHEPVWRFRVPTEEVNFEDAIMGPQSLNVSQTVGDFVAFKSSRQPSYQMAVVADDIAMGISQVIRGNDLIPSTARQMLIYRALGRPAPQWGHVPLIIGPDGKRIAKRHGDSRIRHLRDSGVDPRHIVGTLAAWTGLSDGKPCTPDQLVGNFNFKKIPHDPLVLNPDKLLILAGSNN